MRLQDVKEQIDRFFDNIDAEELYRISVEKYNFTEVFTDLEDELYETVKTYHYPIHDEMQSSFSTDSTEEGNLNLVLAA